MDYSWTLAQLSKAIDCIARTRRDLPVHLDLKLNDALRLLHEVSEALEAPTA